MVCFMASGPGGSIPFQKMGMGDCRLLLACSMHLPCNAQQRYFPFPLRSIFHSKIIETLENGNGFSTPIRPAITGLIRDAEVAEQDTFYKESGDADSL